LGYQGCKSIIVRRKIKNPVILSSRGVFYSLLQSRPERIFSVDYLRICLGINPVAILSSVFPCLSQI